MIALVLAGRGEFLAAADRAVPSGVTVSPAPAIVPGAPGACSAVGPLGCLPPPGSFPPDELIHQTYWDFHNASNVCPRLDDVQHPNLTGVFVSVPWSVTEATPGVRDFCRFEEHIRIWDAAGKKVILRNTVSGEGDLPGNQPGAHWPAWLCCEPGRTRNCIPCLSFCDNAAATAPTNFPVTWNSAYFLRRYRAYVAALADWYDGDPRIAYVWIGVGHLGYTTASPSRGGDCALRDAGWTPEAWEQYIYDVIDLYAAAFQSTPLLLAVTPLWTRSFSSDVNAEEYLAALERVTDYAVARGASILLNGLNECPELYAVTPFSELLEHLAARPLPANFTLMMGDDFPLWSKERPDEAFGCLLQTARLEWRNQFDARRSLAIKMQRNEVRASNPADLSDFVPSVGAFLGEFLADQPSLSTADANMDGVADACVAFACDPLPSGVCNRPVTDCLDSPRPRGPKRKSGPSGNGE